MAKPRKKLRILPLIGVIIIALGLIYSGVALSRPTPAIAAIRTNPFQPKSEKTTSLPWPKYGQAAIGAVGYGVLTTNGDQKPLATASTAKILTALAVLDKHPLKVGEQGPMITITRQDQAIYDYYYVRDGSLAAQKVGEKISEYQALEAMLLPSGNNFADILAIWAYGSLASYSNYANQYAKTLGMTQTHVVDGSGFSGKTTSTASDLTKLGLKAIQNPVITKIVGEKEAKIPVAGTIYNVNWLLGVNGIIGMKTGNNNQDHGAFMAATQFTVAGKPVIMVSVVMGAPHLDNALADSLPLINKAKTKFHNETIINKGQVVGYYLTPWGDRSDAIATRSVTTLTWGDNYSIAEVGLDNIKTPVDKGERVGSIKTSLASGQQQVPVELKTGLAGAPWSWRISHF